MCGNGVFNRLGLGGLEFVWFGGEIKKALSRTECITIYSSSQVSILPNGQQNILAVTPFPFFLLEHSHLKQLIQLFTNDFRKL